MLNVIPQDKFERASFPSDAAINVHKRTDLDAEALVVFVHGLNGSPYGTWRRFPELLFDQKVAAIDVAVFRYRNGFRRIATLGGPRMESIEELLANQLANSGYARIILIGHSMGGCVARGAIKQLHLTNPSDTTKPDIATILMATPQGGSGWAYWIFPRDRRYLKPLSTERSTTDTWFKDNVENTIRSPEFGSPRKHIPSVTALGAYDKVVSALSATLSAASSETARFPSGHGSIVKPKDEQSTVFQWVSVKIKEVLVALDQPAVVPRRDKYFADSLLVAFNAPMDSRRFREVYSEARIEVRNRHQVEIDNPAGYGEQITIDLLVRVLYSHSINDERSTRLLLSDDASQRSQRVLHLAVSPYGDDEGASSEIEALIKEGPEGGAFRIIEHTSSIDELRAGLVEWMSLAALERPRRPQYSDSSDLRNRAVIQAELRRGLGSDDGYYGGPYL